MAPNPTVGENTVQAPKTRKTKCKKPPVTVSKSELRDLHKQKMDRKEAERNMHAGKPTRKYYVVGNLSKGHKRRGLHPSQSYSD